MLTAALASVIGTSPQRSSVFPRIAFEDLSV
jgi:hypothetical protein